MTLTATAKAKIYIGTSTYPTNSNTVLALADYSADTYTEIGQISSIGDFGDSSSEIKFDTIGDARTYKLKGQQDAGDLALECGFDDSDPGQILIMTANADSFNRSFKVVFNNPLAPAGKGSTSYFRGLVMSATTKLGAANSVIALSVKVAVNTVPLRIAASAT